MVSCNYFFVLGKDDPLTYDVNHPQKISIAGGGSYAQLKKYSSKCLCNYIYICTYIHTYIYIHMCIHIYMNINTCIMHMYINIYPINRYHLSVYFTILRISNSMTLAHTKLPYLLMAEFLHHLGCMKPYK